MFFVEEDRLTYLRWLREYCERCKVKVLAYCLMTGFNLEIPTIPETPKIDDRKIPEVLRNVEDQCRLRFHGSDLIDKLENCDGAKVVGIPVYFNPGVGTEETPRKAHPQKIRTPFGTPFMTPGRLFEERKGFAAFQAGRKGCRGNLNRYVYVQCRSQEGEVVCPSPSI